MLDFNQGYGRTAGVSDERGQSGQSTTVLTEYGLSSLYVLD